MKPILTVQAVTKTFRTYHHYHVGLKSLVLNPSKLFKVSTADQFLAIDNVSFSVDRGETFGILGRNGAGKSTLLALIAGILLPTSGIIQTEGRIAPLLELGVGFTLELSGRENILINGVLLGLPKREVESKIDSIIEFSGLSAFIDQPLKTYSSGMQTRLGFAIAVNVRPDILLIDEVLAVGDAEFQRKCLARIAELRNIGVTIVLVSHSLQTLESMCSRAAWIEQGHLRSHGSPIEVINQYRSEIAMPPAT